MDFGKAIKVLMVERDLSVADVASRTGWSEPYIYHCRNNNPNATPQARLSEWADLFGLTPSEFMKMVESYPDPPSFQRKA